MANILVIRFSALGDIAMTVPVISEMARQYPEHNITMLSRGFVAPLFNGLAPNISFRGVDLKADKYKGIGGIYRLYKELKTDKYDYIIDLHDVLRTKILRTFFRLNGAKVSSIDKERAKRNRYIKTKDKLHRLSTSFEKYTLAFNRAGFTFNNGFISIFGNSTPSKKKKFAEVSFPVKSPIISPIVPVLYTAPANTPDLLPMKFPLREEISPKFKTPPPEK